MRPLYLALVVILLVGCSGIEYQSHDPQFVVSLDELQKELRNPNYRWDGPTSVEDRIPTLHAARALAYRGDSSARTLFDAVDDSEVEVISVLDAISNLGVPSGLFHDQIMNRDSTELRKWWTNNRVATLKERNFHRKQIGLPPAEIGK